MMKKLFISLAGVIYSLWVMADPANPDVPSTWKVTANNYQYSMTVTTALVFDLDESRDVTDKIAAFVGDDCRGVAQPITYIPEDDRFLAHLLVYSNTVEGDSITLYMFDHSSGDIVEVAAKLAFVSNATYGNVSDPYLSRNSYNITFNILANDNPVDAAMVFLDGYGTKETQADGEVIFYDVIPSDSIYFSIAASGYETYENSLSLVDGDLNKTVDMELEAYDVTFNLTNGIIPLKDISVDLNGYSKKNSNVYGNAKFDRVKVEEQISYTVSGEGYYSISGALDVTNGPVNKKITLTAVTHNVSFHVTDQENAVEEVAVTCIVNADPEVEDFFIDQLPQSFSTAGNKVWTIENSAAFQGQYGLRSGDIYDNQLSEVSLERYTQAGSGSFYVKVSSEPVNDYLAFRIDGVEEGRWSGETDWNLVTFEVTRGNHLFEWIYKKDGSSANGNDCAWLDYIVTPPSDTIVSTIETDANGNADFYNMDPNKQILYSIYNSDYEMITDTIMTLPGDTVIDIRLIPVFQVHFKVVSTSTTGNVDVRNAWVRFPDLERADSTDSFGEVTFGRISQQSNIGYVVDAEGYETYNGEISISDADVDVEVKLSLTGQMRASNFLSPNGDGKNDTWIIFDVEKYAAFRIDIFSSVGEKLFSTTDYGNHPWDGKVNGYHAPDGVYYYIATSPGNKIVFKGLINLIN